MKHILWTLAASACLITATGCKTDNDHPNSETASLASSSATRTCQVVIDPATQHVANLSVSGKTFTIAQSSTTGRFGMLTFQISKVMLMIAPVDTPRLQCNSGTLNMTVWDNILRVNAEYFRLESADGSKVPSTSAPTTDTSTQTSTSGANECTTVDAATQTTLTIGMKGSALYVVRSSPTARYAPLNYSLSKVMLTVAPSGTPLYSCQDGQKVFMVWDKYARVGSQYFTLSPVK